MITSSAPLTQITDQQDGFKGNANQQWDRFERNTNQQLSGFEAYPQNQQFGGFIANPQNPYIVRITYTVWAFFLTKIKI